MVGPTHSGVACMFIGRRAERMRHVIFHESYTLCRALTSELGEDLAAGSGTRPEFISVK